MRGGDAADERGEGSTEESARDRDEGGNDEFTPEWDSISPGESPTSWKMAIRAIEERDERFEKAVADLDQAQSTILRQEEELTRLMQSRVEMESELERRRAREETLAKLLQDGDEKVAVGVTENASDEEDRPVQVGDDGFPVDWPEEARKLLRRMERKIKFGNASSAKDRVEAESQALEARVRAAEQAHLLGRLEAASQTIWELTDAASRVDAKLASSSRELEGEREARRALLDELEVVRRLLMVEQTRGLERERLLADARTEVAGLSSARSERAGAGRRDLVGEEADDEDAGMGDPRGLVDLGAHDASVGNVDEGPEPG